MTEARLAPDPTPARLEAGPTEILPGLLRVLAPNPGPMTLDGTNTWVLGHGAGPVLVIDPGPAGDGHHERVLAAIGGRGVAGVALTHMHPDHSEGAWTLAATVEAPVLRHSDGTLADGQDLPAGLRVLETPGHSSDSVSLVWERGPVFTGDTILGRGTAVVAHPDGALAPYLSSLRRLQSLGDRLVLPGHGPTLADLGGVAAAYLAHRHARLAQVRDAQASGATTAREVVERVYADVEEVLWPAAELSVRAQLDWLAEQD